MSNPKSTYEVVIVGGGPVGLFLGLCLQKAGISLVILEKRVESRPGSRSLGIHPVSLELFDQLGIADPFVNTGIRIAKGHAYSSNGKIGTISFENCPKPFNYILALPQQKTEMFLEQELCKLNQDLLIRNAVVTGTSQTDQHVKITYKTGGETKTLTASYVVGCDGKDSFVRQQAGISFEGKSYPDTYIMGDFTDNTIFGSDAAIFICREGLIESFPLLDGKRRWVVKTDDYISPVDRREIEERVASRIGHDLGVMQNVMLNSFGVQKLIAKPMVKNRILLAGDAAHIVSPIGGQGMNLGWLGAWDLAESLRLILEEDQSPEKVLEGFENRRIKAARNAIRRAEMNMRLGRKSNLPAIRNSIVWLMLNTPLSNLMARIFTMRGVGTWII